MSNLSKLRDPDNFGVEFTLVVIGALLLSAACIASGAWILMLAFGVVHSAFVAVPAFGFWPTAAIAGGVSVLLSWLRR